LDGDPHLVNDFRGVYARFGQFFPLSGRQSNSDILFGDLGQLSARTATFLSTAPITNILGDTVTYTVAVTR